ncbi:Na+/H+ antiporter NhaA [Gaetbulibacter saemankumensis]|uniref:Na+/H+ antiporter NhaA n=1 Tax=Gaetbulibacter saemankumensis TaxID=311208 RepID=UPI000411CFDC|nr:Na+/H+ antiporter NhaA [Gaetbulibacter saemankumensis]
MNKIIVPFNRFVKSSNSASFLLLFATVLALMIANSPWSIYYHELLKSEFTFGFLESGFELTEPFLYV